MSTPEILERVYTIESEILQIEEAIAIQGNNSIGISTVSEYVSYSMILWQHLNICFNNHAFLQVEENQVKHVENTQGTFERSSKFISSYHCVQTSIEQLYM